MNRVVRVGVLASGNGSNLQALLHADLGPARIAVTIVNRPGAKARDRAHQAGVEALVIDHRSFSSRQDFDAAIVQALRRRDVTWVVLAGFMRIVSDVVLTAFPNRVVNIHPSLLPAFPGIDAQKQALKAGVKISGCTVHLVDSGLDSGPILAQTAVPVLPNDSVEDLSKRILRQEHQLLPQVVRALAEGNLRVGENGSADLAHVSDAQSTLANLSLPSLPPFDWPEARK